MATQNQSFALTVNERDVSAFRGSIPPMKLFGFCFIRIGILIFCIDSVRAARGRDKRAEEAED
jgi:hypothetical protein